MRVANPLMFSIKLTAPNGEIHLVLSDDEPESLIELEYVLGDMAMSGVASWSDASETMNAIEEFVHA